MVRGRHTDIFDKTMSDHAFCPVALLPSFLGERAFRVSMPEPEMWSSCGRGGCPRLVVVAWLCFLRYLSRARVWSLDMFDTEALCLKMVAKHGRDKNFPISSPCRLASVSFSGA